MAGKGRQRTRAPQRPRQHSAGPKGRQIVGLHAVRECLQVRPESARELWVREGKRSSELESLVGSVQSKKIPVKEKSAQSLDTVAHQNQGVCLFADELPSWGWEGLSAEVVRIVVLDQLEDPHNFGAIIRTSWLMGVTAIIATEHRSVGLTPAVHKVASGGVEHVPVLFQSSLATCFERLKEEGFWIYGLAAEGSQSLYSMVFPPRVVIVAGAEESGLRKSTQGGCDDLIAIPQVTEAASYNVSVASGIVLGEVCRQQTAQNSGN